MHFQDVGQSPLWKASCNGHHAVVKVLITAGANLNKADKVSLIHYYRRSKYPVFSLYSNSIFITCQKGLSKNCNSIICIITQCGG